MVRRRDYERLNVMTGYCKTTGCLRGYLLDYFGQPHRSTGLAAAIAATARGNM